MTDRVWHDGLDPQQRRMVRLLITAICAIYNVSWAEIVAQDRHPRQCEARSWIVWSLSADAGLRAAQIGRIMQRRDAQVHETIHKMKDRRVTTPFLHTRARLDTVFATLNRGDPITEEDPAWYDAWLSQDEEAG